MASALPDTRDARLFALVDWEIATASLSNQKYHQLFATVIPHLEPNDINQDMHIRRCYFSCNDAALMVHYKMKFKTIEPAHRAFSSAGETC